MKGSANDVTQKIVGRGKSRRIANKTTEEMQAEKSPEVEFEKQAANITNEQWQDILAQLDDLKTHSIKTGE